MMGDVSIAVSNPEAHYFAGINTLGASTGADTQVVGDLGMVDAPLDNCYMPSISRVRQ